MLREIKENLNRWRTTLYSLIRKINIVRMLILYNLIYRFNTILHQNPSRLSVEGDNLIFKFRFTWKCIGLSKSGQSNFVKNKVGAHAPVQGRL